MTQFQVNARTLQLLERLVYPRAALLLHLSFPWHGGKQSESFMANLEALKEEVWKDSDETLDAWTRLDV